MTDQTFTHEIAYARFSSQGQRDGTSLERQFGNIDKEVARLGLVITRRIADEGESGYHGHHRTRGNFGRFEAETLAGEWIGARLWIENLDRLTREGPYEALALIHNLNQAGLTIRTLDGGEFPAYAKPDLIQIVKVAAWGERAEKESARKAELTSNNWRIKAKRARDGIAMTRLTKAWCFIGEDGRNHSKAGAADILMRIFTSVDEQALGGLRLANMLNAEGVEPWATWEKDGKKRQPKAWRRNYISDLLKDRAVTGEFQPMKVVDGKRVPDGNPIPDYYPQIIPVDLFERVASQAARRARKDHSGGRNARDELPNLFGSLVRCKECGRALSYKRWNKAGRNKAGKSYARDQGSLICQTAHEGGCSNRKYLAYLTFEEAVLRVVLHIAMDDTAFSRKDEVARLNVTIAERAREAEIATQTAESLWLVWAKNKSDMKERLAEEAEAEAERLQANVAALRVQLEEAKGAVSSTEHIARVEDVRRGLYCEDRAQRFGLRNKVAVSLKQVVSSIRVDNEGVATVSVAGGLVVFKIRKGVVSDLDQEETIEAMMSGVINFSRKGHPARADVRKRIEKRRPG
jgi:hypothetical protein